MKSTRREAKVQWMKNIIKDFFIVNEGTDQVIDKKILIAKFSLEFNSTERTGREILTVLENAGEINVANGFIVS